MKYECDDTNYLLYYMFLIILLNRKVNEDYYHEIQMVKMTIIIYPYGEYDDLHVCVSLWWMIAHTWFLLFIVLLLCVILDVLHPQSCISSPHPPRHPRINDYQDDWSIIGRDKHEKHIANTNDIPKEYGVTKSMMLITNIVFASW